ncbi:hypothetical protein AAEU32_13365 [Pseudoalteromonas sp. SSDWG2]|uniref:hypothetical protein n=1 Tax=Pseudoalteromonas sp. SSDWG2 TaxID=3139391 RepID=UPI003BA897F7
MSIDDNERTSECCTFHPHTTEIGTFAISEDSVSPETPFEVSLTLNKQGAVKSAAMTGVTMYMGTIPVQFTQVDTHKWVARIMVGSCSEPRMVWHLNVDIQYQGQARSVFYPITVSQF